MKRILICAWLVAIAIASRAEPVDQNLIRRGKANTPTTTTDVQRPVVTPRVHTNQSVNAQRNLSRGPLRNNVNVQAGANSQFRARHFELNRGRAQNQQAIKFRQNSAIVEAQRWQGPHYAAFRNYRAQWHDRDWWRSHHNRIVLVFGAPYYWDAGWWYPAWGFDPYASYYYDGPIYAYNDLSPDQIVANVQASLQEQGYYEGEIDGVLGPLTRAAIAAYQADQGIYVTAAIDEPTLESLGMI